MCVYLLGNIKGGEMADETLSMFLLPCIVTYACFIQPAAEIDYTFGKKRSNSEIPPNLPSLRNILRMRDQDPHPHIPSRIRPSTYSSTPLHGDRNHRTSNTSYQSTKYLSKYTTSNQHDLRNYARRGRSGSKSQLSRARALVDERFADAGA